MEKLVSVIVPIYNGEKFLEECIQSIINQTYKNLEIILINDGSTDGTLKICQEYSSIDKRIILVNKENEGVSIARNIGISLAKGHFISFVDCDDCIDTRFCEILTERISQDATDCVTLINHTIDSPRVDYSTKNQIIKSKDALNEIIMLRFPTSLWAYLYKKETLKNIKLSTDIHFFEDFEFNLRILSNCEKVSVEIDNIYNYRHHFGSTNSQKLSNRKLSCLKIYDKINPHLQALGDAKIINDSIYFRARFLFGLICIAEKNSDKNLLDQLEIYSRRILIESIRSNLINSWHKILISSCAINIKIITHFIKPIYRIKNKKSI